MDDEPPESAPPSEPFGEDGGVIHAALRREGDSPPRVDDPPGALTRGTSIGQYVILSQLSAGDGDSVYAAFDARRDRKVALKVIEVTEGRGGDAELRREAMIASVFRCRGLEHPGIVEVLDAGTVGEWVYVAMEFIDGIDLRQWMEARDDPFPWPEVLRVFREAGSALAAAHAAGCVHGDFTPSRVFMEKSGRICVFDFGIASGVEDMSSPGLSVKSLTDGLASEAGDDSVVEHPRRSSPLGTPDYLAPETHAGIEPDAKADQFAFCAAMYEALYGEVPFKGDSPSTIAGAALAHQVRPAPEGADVPQWLRDVLLKGLSPRRRDRFASMEVLLRDLEYDPRGRRRRWTAGIVLLGTAAVCVGAVAYLVHQEASKCEADDALLEGAWDPGTRAALEAAFSTSGQRPVVDAWDGVESNMDEWSTQWLHYRTLACNVRRADDDEALFSARNACLDGILQPFAAFSASDPGDRLLRDAQRVLSGLWRPADCRSADVIAYARLEDPTAQAPVDRAWLELLAGDARAARTAAIAAAEDLSAKEHPATSVRAKLIAGLAAERLGSPDAVLLLEQASATAAAASLRIPQVEAWLALGRADDVANRSVWLEHAQTMVETLDVDRLRARTAAARAALLRAQGRGGDALAAYHRALDFLPDDDPRTPIERADILIELSELAASREEWTTAQRNLQEVVRSREAVFGPLHHELLGPLGALGTAQLRLGALDDAARTIERALGLAALDDALPPLVAALHTTLAEVETNRNRSDVALAHRVTAVRSLEGTRNDDALAHALFALGVTEFEHGSARRAISALERASVLAARLRWQGTQRVDLHETLGSALEPEDSAAALAEFRKALSAASGTRAIRLEARIEALERAESPSN